jgi:nitrate/nitrite-specific signal transduction histidine kinase
MGKKGYAGRRYVEKVREDTQRYARALLAENDHLQLRVLALEEDRRLLRERAASSEQAAKDNLTLRSLVDAAEAERDRLRSEARQLRDELDRREQDWTRLREDMAKVEEESRRYWEQYAYVEHQNSDLASLYVASYRLHTTLDRTDLVTAIFEILTNLVGCEEAAIFEMEEAGEALSLVGWNGIDPARYRRVPLGSGAIGAAASRGETYLASQPEPEDGLTACVPLKLEDRVTGAIAIFRLLPQKPGLQDLDRELFDLLAEQAATALYCTRLHADRVRAAAELEA